MILVVINLNRQQKMKYLINQEWKTLIRNCENFYGKIIIFLNTILNRNQSINQSINQKHIFSDNIMYIIL